MEYSKYVNQLPASTSLIRNSARSSSDAWANHLRPRLGGRGGFPGVEVLYDATVTLTVPGLGAGGIATVAGTTLSEV